MAIPYQRDIKDAPRELPGGFPSALEAVAFLTALDATDRTARDRWVRAQGVDKADAVAIGAAKERFQLADLLGDEHLAQFAARVARESGGEYLLESSPVHFTCWRGKFGVGDPNRCGRCGRLRADHGGDRGGSDCQFESQEPGVSADSTLGEFAAWLVDLASCIAPKGAGVVCCPTVNLTGLRVNEATTAMTALNLDCDGRGSWDAFIAALDRLDLAYIVYQSGGWSPTAQKWHALLFLARPFDTSSPEKIESWKDAYNAARVVFGALARLRGDGFDPTVETPCTPVFVTERRREEDPPRRVVWRAGRALDLERLVSLLPAAERDDRSISDRARAPSLTLDETGFDRILSTLLEPMSAIMSGRRDLYLALPGALLDRGVEPDDVRALVEELSRRCPGDPRYTRAEVATRHKQHAHDCETTIRCWERGAEYTRIGTLQARWPEVAAAVDAALPDPFVSAIRARIWSAFARRGATSASGAPSSTRAVDLGALRGQLVEMRRRKMARKEIGGVLVGALLDGEDLIPRYEDEAAGEQRVALTRRGEPYTRATALSAVAAMVGGKLPIGTAFEHVAPLFRRSVHAMLSDGERPNALMAVAEQAFLRAVGDKIERDDETRAMGRALREALDREGDI